MTLSPLKMHLNPQGEQVIELGFSGSRIGMSPLQLQLVKRSLLGKTGIAHHGDCIGSDAEFHDLLRNEFPGKWRIVIHPPIKNELRAFKLGDEVREPKEYMERNRDIVAASGVFFATPKSKRETGGTWRTIGFFRNLLANEYGKPNVPHRMGFIFLPNGDTGQIIQQSRHGSIDLNNVIT